MGHFVPIGNGHLIRHILASQYGYLQDSGEFIPNTGYIAFGTVYWPHWEVYVFFDLVYASLSFLRIFFPNYCYVYLCLLLSNLYYELFLFFFGTHLSLFPLPADISLHGSHSAIVFSPFEHYMYKCNILQLYLVQ